MNSPRTLLTALLLLLAPLALWAQAPPPEIVKITLQPAQAPRPALKYRLSPESLDVRSGNAATLYLKALLMLPSDKESKDLHNKVAEWNDLPLDKLPRDEVRKALGRFANSLDQTELAALRDHCDWGLPIRESENPFAILLPEIQESRTIARLLMLQARLEIAERKFERAIGTLRTTISLARHVSQAPTLINALVGMAILGMVDKTLEEMISQPDAPSIYWAVTTLPDPMIDMTQAMELDANSIYLLLPDLHAARNKKLSDNEWKALHERVQTKMARLATDLAGLGTPENPWNAAVQAVRAVQSLATAKPRLMEYGYSQADVEAMPIDKLALLHDMLLYEDYRDEMFKWYSVPYYQIGDRMDKLEARLREGPSTIIVVSPQLILPAVKSVRAAMARTERRQAALRLLDALRLHAGGHDGKLPEKLDDVTIVPLPTNPATGMAFEYELQEGLAVLKAAGPNPVEYRIELAK